MSLGLKIDEQSVASLAKLHKQLVEVLEKSDLPVGIRVLAAAVTLKSAVASTGHTHKEMVELVDSLRTLGSNIPPPDG
jgi:hypothetical protein